MHWHKDNFTVLLIVLAVNKLTQSYDIEKQEIILFAYKLSRGEICAANLKAPLGMV